MPGDPMLDGTSAEGQSNDCANPHKRAVRHSNALKILVVDNEPVCRLLLGKVLTKLGHVPFFAENGIEALRCLDEETVDLILMDIKMPIMDGVETTRRIRQGGTPAHPATPVVAVTACIMQRDLESIIEAGADDCLSKPIDLNQLEMVLAQFALR